MPEKRDVTALTFKDRPPRASWEALNGNYTTTAPTRVTVTIYVR